METLRRLALALALAAAAGPALAYTIYLKDGSQLLAKQKYEVQGERAIITLVNGTRTAFALAEIDVPRTDKANEQDLGTAILIESGKAGDLAHATPPPAKPKLEDLIRSGATGVREQDAAPAAGPPARPPGFAAEPPPRAQRAPLRDVALATTLMGVATAQGLQVEITNGGSARTPLLVFQTESEASVFRALLAGAAALIEARSKHPGAVEGLDLLCETSDGALGARFALSPQQAADLLAGRTDVSQFFVDHVLF